MIIAQEMVVNNKDYKALIKVNMKVNYIEKKSHMKLNNLK
jgi:hypothetical protein